MAFLDNSGDIILDAVLTETGRRRLAQATRFGGSGAKITRFCLGDDEINYAQYDLNSPSGSNYADLQILQTPVMEAWTMGNSTIKYGLLSERLNTILYLPSLKINNLSTEAFPALQPYNNISYMAVNQETSDCLLKMGLRGPQIARADQSRTSQKIFVESGLNTAELTKTMSNQKSYIASTGISNPSYRVGIDRRLRAAVWTTNGKGTFSNTQDNTDERRGFGFSTAGRDNTGGTMGLINYDFFVATPVRDNVVEPSSGGSASAYSVIVGPGDNVMGFMFNVKTGLQTQTSGVRDILYTQIGTTGISSTALFGVAGNTFDYIDSIVYVYGTRTGTMINIPVRIIRKAS